LKGSISGWNVPSVRLSSASNGPGSPGSPRFGAPVR
jgi:hypothetical protein